MADLNDGTTDYPGTLDTNTTEPTGDPTDPTPIEGAKLAAVAIQTELGVNPAGNLADVVTRLDVETDSDGKHTFKLPHMFMQDNVAASQAAVALALAGALPVEIEMPWAGSVVGVSVLSNDSRTAGTLTVDATINGAVTGLQAVLDGTNPDHHSASQAIDADAFVVGDRIGVKITTDAGWLPVTADIVVVVYVSFN